jgi:hypothetical protein
MRVGFALGKIGPIGTADNIVRIAQHTEALRYDSLWTVERLPWPVPPQSPDPGTADGSLPVEYQHVLDPLEAMTSVAAHTQRIALGLVAFQADEGHSFLGYELAQGHDYGEATGALIDHEVQCLLAAPRVCRPDVDGRARAAPTSSAGVVASGNA